jgi:hypothetical protein
MIEGAERGLLHGLVGPGGAVPVEGEAAPVGDRVGVVEGIDDERGDGQVERHEAVMATR